MSTGGPLLELAGVVRTFRNGDNEIHALAGISLAVAEGEYVAIIGQSGSGKSTLMNILGCLDRPTEGRYAVRGVDVAEFDADELAELRRDTFGFVFQRYNLLSGASAAENVEIPAVYAGRSRRERVARAHDLLHRLGLGDRADHRPGQLSGGQQQRVSIARALMNDPAVILADEPTGALDTASGRDVLDLLDELHREGRTILLITHDATVAARAERIIHLSDGRMVADEPGRIRTAVTADRVGHRRPASRLGLVAGFSEAVKMAFRSLRTNLFRTALTLLGVVIGVAAVVAMLAIGGGSKQDVMTRIQKMGTNLLLVRPGAPGIRASGDYASLLPADAEAIARLDNVAAVSPERQGGNTIRFGNVDYRTMIVGIWPGYAKARDWEVAEGTFIIDDDVKGYAPVVILGRTVARNLFPDQDPVGSYVLIKSVPFEVIGVLAGKGATPFGSDADDVALVPLSTALNRIFGRTYVNGITVQVTDAALMDQTQQAIETLLRDRHGTEDFQIRNTSSILETAIAAQNTLTILLGSVALISLLVGGIGVMNIMLVSVTERTREIGIRMATGARMQNILLQFNTEAVVVCGIGGMMGVALGFAVAAVAAMFGIPVVYGAIPSLLAFACAFFTGLVFGFLPARKAARLDPVVALASE